AFYMTDPLKPGGHAELWINRREWDKYAAQLVDEAPTEWHDWKNRISYSKSRHGRAA
ncbi:Cox family DNA-binding protein, partial [Escherichia coli]